jgi:hypothetical protein
MNSTGSPKKLDRDGTSDLAPEIGFPTQQTCGIDSRFEFAEILSVAFRVPKILHAAFPFSLKLPRDTYTKLEDLDFVKRGQFYLWLPFLP